MPFPFPCSPVIRECFWKKNPDRKKKNNTLDHHLKVHGKGFSIHLVPSFLQWKFFLPKSVFFGFCFLPDAFYIDVGPKSMMPEAVNNVCMPSLCFHERIFLLSLVIISVWGECVSDRNLLGDIKISPWKCRYRLRIKVAIVLISISKKVSPSGNQALLIFLFSNFLFTSWSNWIFSFCKPVLYFFLCFL